MESKEGKSPRAFTSSSVPNSSSTSAMSVTLAIESHSAVFEVFAFARVPPVSAGNTVEKHFISLLRTSSIHVLRGPSSEPPAHHMSAFGHGHSVASPSKGHAYHAFSFASF